MRPGVTEAGADGYELVVPATVDNLDRVHDLVETMRADAAGDEALRDWIRFETALIEIVGNVIEHSVPAGPGATMELRLHLSRPEDDLLAVIVDDGAPVRAELDASHLPDGDEERGRGLAMARLLGAVVECRRDGNHNVWSIRCRREG